MHNEVYTPERTFFLSLDRRDPGRLDTEQRVQGGATSGRWARRVLPAWGASSGVDEPGRRSSERRFTSLRRSRVSDRAVVVARDDIKHSAHRRDGNVTTCHKITTLDDAKADSSPA
ncbi:hypothetical protein MTO96_008575 [Rhipicephalus appendiculatus]